MTNTQIAKLYLAANAGTTATALDAAILDGSALTAVNALSQTDFLNAAYQAAFGRNADAEGLAYWGNRLDNGLTTTELVDSLVAGAASYVAPTVENPLVIGDVSFTAAPVERANDVTISTLKATAEAAASSATVGSVVAAVATVVDATTSAAAIVTIDAADATADADADAAATPTYTIAAAASSVTEGNTITFTVTASEAMKVTDTTLNYNIAGVAAAGGTADPLTDLGILNGTVAIAAGETTGTITLTAATDTATEGYEGFQVSILDANFAATVTSATVAITDPANAGQSFTLTTGIDADPEFTGGLGDDTYTAVVNATASSTNATLTALDNIDGGAGNDVLNINDLTTAATDAGTDDGGVGAGTPVTTIDLSVATITNIETINIAAVGDIASVINSDATGPSVNTTLDFSTTAGLTTLNTTKSVDAMLTAAATTDVNVSGATGNINVVGGKDVSVTDATTATAIIVGDATGTNANPAGTITVTDTDNTGAANDITVTGGTNVTVTATASLLATGDIVVGNATNGTATGAVVVTQNLIDDGTGLNNSALPITVTGGSTVAVNVNGTSTATAANSTALQLSATQVISDSTTTAVTVTETGTVNTFTSAAVAQVNASSVVTFVAMTAGETTVVNGLTFTAAKTLTASEVAVAFSNLANDDTQASTGQTANGVFTGASSTSDWVSGAVSGATVTYTNATSAELANTLVVSDSAAAGNVATVTTAGTAASGGVTTANSVAYGAVQVDGHATASIKTVTVDGFASADLGLTGTDLNALTTLNLSNNTANGNVDVATTATALALNVDNITSTTSVINLDRTAATVKDLTITSSGTASTFDLTDTALVNLTVDAAVALNIATNSAGYVTPSLLTVDVNGAGAVNLGVVSAATAINTFDASGNTGGVTATIDTDATTMTGSISDFIFSEGNDTVTINATGTLSDIAVTLGAGNDTVIMSAGDVNAAAMIAGGTGMNTIQMLSADANTATTTSTLELMISDFSKLSLGAVATNVQDTVNLDNIDDISYVISAGTTDAAKVATITFAGTETDAANEVLTTTITDAGGTTTFTTTVTSSTAATAGTTVSAPTTNVTGTSAQTYTVTELAGVVTITGSTNASFTTATASTTPGTTIDITAGALATTSSELTLTNMANDGTLEITGAGAGTIVTMADATGSADTFNVFINSDTSVAAGTVTVNGVETIDLTSTDIFIDSTVPANGLDNNVAAHTVGITGDVATTINVDGSAATTLQLSAASVLTAVDASAMTGALTVSANGTKAMTITGGAAADALTAIGSGDTLIGGAGTDTLTGADLTTLTGGAGADTFMMNVPTSVNAYSTITDLLAGDVIDLDGANGGTVVFSSSKIVLADTAVFQDYANATAVAFAADADDAAWFQYSGNTFVIQSGNATNGNDFVSASDGIIKINGLVDLSTASYNQTNGTLEIA